MEGRKSVAAVVVGEEEGGKEVSACLPPPPFPPSRLPSSLRLPSPSLFLPGLPAALFFSPPSLRRGLPSLLPPSSYYTTLLPSSLLSG